MQYRCSRIRTAFHLLACEPESFNECSNNVEAKEQKHLDTTMQMIQSRFPIINFYSLPFNPGITQVIHIFTIWADSMIPPNYVEPNFIQWESRRVGHDSMDVYQLRNSIENWMRYLWII